MQNIIGIKKYLLEVDNVNHAPLYTIVGGKTFC